MASRGLWPRSPCRGPRPERAGRARSQRAPRHPGSPAPQTPRLPRRRRSTGRPGQPGIPAPPQAPIPGPETRHRTAQVSPLVSPSPVTVVGAAHRAPRPWTGPRETSRQPVPRAARRGLLTSPTLGTAAPQWEPRTTTHCGPALTVGAGRTTARRPRFLTAPPPTAVPSTGAPKNRPLHRRTNPRRTCTTSRTRRRHRPLRLPHPPRPVSYTHLDVYKRQG